MASKKENERLVALMQRADVMNIEYTDKTTANELSKRIKKAMGVDEGTTKDITPTRSSSSAPLTMEERSLRARKEQLQLDVGVDDKGVPMTDNAKRAQMNELVHCNIHCNNPLKKDWTGQLFSATNDLGTQKKFILFDYDYMVPRILLNVIKEAQRMKIIKKKTDKGIPYKKAINVREFTIDLLPDITEEELDIIRTRQSIQERAHEVAA